MISNHIPVKLAYLTERYVDLPDARSACLLDDLIEDCFCGLLFTHRMSELYDMRFIPNRRLVLESVEESV